MSRSESMVEQSVGAEAAEVERGEVDCPVHETEDMEQCVPPPCVQPDAACLDSTLYIQQGAKGASST
jgi:hypothetical protein